MEMPESVSEFELRRAHSALVSAYLSVLNEASFEVFSFDEAMHRSHETSLGRLFGTLDVVLDFLGRRWMTRRLVRSHVRRRLLWVSAAYAQLHALAEARDRAGFAEWLHNARGRTAEVADSLPTWRAPSALAVLAPTIALVGAARGVIPYVAVAGVIVLLLVFYLSIPLVFAFRRKRAFFLDPVVDDRNVYECEDELFRMIERRKPREFQLDVGFVAIVVVVMYALVVLAVGLDSIAKEGLLGILGFAIIVAAIWAQDWYASRWDHGQY